MAALSASTWVAPAVAVAEELGPGLEAIWTLLYAAQIGTHRLALTTPLDDDRPLSGAAWHLQVTLEKFEEVRPDLAQNGVAIDPGPAPLDQAVACREALCGVLDVALGVMTAMLAAGDQQTVTWLPVLARATVLVGAARTQLTARPGAQRPPS